jgi:hypothetical protein
VTKIKSQTLDNIHHRLNHECDKATDVDVAVAIDMDVDMAIDMDVHMYVNVADDVDANSPCFYGPVSSGPNIFGLLIF